MTAVASRDRRAVIRELLLADAVHSQGELLDKLEQRGFPCSQPVLSRDLRALGVAKIGGVYQLFEEERVTPLTALRSMLRATSPVEHLVLVRTEPGAASAVARALEAEELEGVEGTIAGDDTVFVALASEEAGLELRRRLDELI